MAQITKMETETEIKCSANKFYEIFRSKVHLMPKICPNLVKDIQLLKGDWDSKDSVKQWTYVAGNSEGVKTSEAIDEENKSITYKAIDGEIAKNYKVYKSTVQVTPKGNGSLVKWTIEYEKANEEVPTPDKYFDLVVNLSKAVESYLLNA
ncbi:MLP-like protein 28 [Corylus avellana]|uniref:MLP-like protein 28 n=1 Tax=Corylus avellana TaxID=13451 RepID=UPI001E23811E|nr:MLP-like protein 28 [Corylus avellana]